MPLATSSTVPVFEPSRPVFRLRHDAALQVGQPPHKRATLPVALAGSESQIAPRAASSSAQLPLRRIGELQELLNCSDAIRALSHADSASMSTAKIVT